MSIHIYSEDQRYKISPQRLLKEWINKIVRDNNYTIVSINIVFTGSSDLKKINKEFLNHNYFTDVITFTYSSEKGLEGEIYIDFETVKENSKRFKESFKKELCRVIIHGVFHMMGFNDSTDQEKSIMRKLEDKALDILVSSYGFKF